MPPTFKTTTASCKCTLKEAFKAAGYEAKKEDIVCYALVSKTSVSSKHELALLKGRELLLGSKAKSKLGIDEGKKKMDLVPASAPSGFTCFVQSTSHNRKVSKGSKLLLVVSGGEAVASAGVKRKPATSAVMKPAPGTPAKKSKKDDGALSELKELFLRFGELGPPAKAAQVPSDAPEGLKGLMKIASHWHIRKGHYNVFDLNLFDKKSAYLDKVCLMGDEEMVQQWTDDHPKPNCGEDSWKCIAATSEYQYIFVNVDGSSKQFGATRCIVNNCFEDRSLTKAPFDNFIKMVKVYAQKYVTFREKSGDDWEDEDPPQFN